MQLRRADMDGMQLRRAAPPSACEELVNGTHEALLQAHTLPARARARAACPRCPRGNYWGLWWCGRRLVYAALIVVALCWRLSANYGWWLAASLARAPPGPRPDAAACAPAPAARRRHGRPRIGVVTLVDPAGASTARFAAAAKFNGAALENKRAYAAHHGYELVEFEARTTPERPAPWSKLLALSEHLEDFDWLLYVDGDALFANPAVCLESLVDGDYDLVLAEDWGGYNTGVFLVRNSAWARDFLKRMWAAATDWGLAARNPWYQHALPFEYEQRALHFFADTATWRRAAARHGRAVPRTTADPRLVRDRIKVVPQCALNSYLVRPRLRPADAAHAAAAYAAGDFVVHLAGHKGPNKAALFAFALDHLVEAPSPATPTCGGNATRARHHRPPRRPRGA